MKVSAANLLSKLPGPRTEQWPQGERFTQALKHGSMSLELYNPVGHDPQTPHQQDELYFIYSGEGQITIGSERYHCVPGDAFFVHAGVEHRFEEFSEDFVTWVVFWGPEGGEPENLSPAK
jgi:mannose-6-phosphate isomerase-like protein (cupin superfamily)